MSDTYQPMPEPVGSQSSQPSTPDPAGSSQPPMPEPIGSSQPPMPQPGNRYMAQIFGVVIHGAS